MKTVLRLPASALVSAETRALSQLREHLGVHFEGVLSRRECAQYARAVYAGRSSWIPNFNGVQFTLGRAWYVHLETDREDEYFENVAASDAAMERFVPGLADRLLAMLRLCLGAEVTRRPDFCGPGVHIFPADEYVSRHGGDVHWDVEGLTEEQVDAHAEAVTAILMLQPAAQGGGLRVWDKLYEDEDTEEEPGSASSEVIVYGAGDLVLIDSYRLHQNLRVERPARSHLGDRAHRLCRRALAGLVLIAALTASRDAEAGGDRGVGHGVDVLGGRDQRVEAAGARVGALLLDEAGDVLDGDDPRVAIAPQEVTPQPELDRAALVLGAPRLVIGVPLEADLRGGRARLPRGLVRIDLGDVGRVDRLAEDGVERLPAQVYRQGDLLIALRPPSGAVHHPEEVRLDPAHPIVAEGPAEPSVLRGEPPDLRGIRLIDDDRGRVVLRQDVAPRLRPARDLGSVGFGSKRHDGRDP